MILIPGLYSGVNKQTGFHGLWNPVNLIEIYLVDDVRMEGLEPPRIAPPDPKSGAATNYATCARAANIKLYN